MTLHVAEDYHDYDNYNYHYYYDHDYDYDQVVITSPGSVLILTCEQSSPAWYKDSVPLTRGPRTHMIPTELGENVTALLLVVPNLEVADSGEYTCHDGNNTDKQPDVVTVIVGKEENSVY